MEFGVLGVLSIVHGGAEVALTSAKQRNILGVLLSRANQATTDGRLAEAVWGDAPPSSATVRWHVHHVRQAIGDDRIRRRGDGYVLLLDPAELDSARFERLLGEARSTADPGQAVRVYGEALGLWRGDAYAELDAVPDETARLEELRLSAYEERARRLLGLDRPAEAAADLAPLVAAHPLRERLRAAYLLALHRSGRRAEALRSYRDGRQHLVAELGVEPGRLLRDAHAQVLGDEEPPTQDQKASSGHPQDAAQGGHPRNAAQGYPQQAALSYPREPAPARAPEAAPGYPREAAPARAPEAAPGYPRDGHPREAASGCPREGHPWEAAPDQDSCAPGAYLAEQGGGFGHGERGLAAHPRELGAAYGWGTPYRNTRAVAPAQLPPDVTSFTGREAELSALNHHLHAGAIAVITGPGGVGKTGLAVHWAHTRLGTFPDGQLAIDLGGLTGPVAPAEALGRFLRALGVAAVPDGLDERVGLYRTLLGRRRMLLLLDNATSAAQVRPLLPGTPGCRVLVTGRGRFDALVAGEGAWPIQLGVLPCDQAALLLSRIAGRTSTAKGELTAIGGASAMRELAALCDRLPLALRIAGARLATRPSWTPGTLADRLRIERARLDELRAGDLDVRAGIARSYHGLAERERLLFCLLGLLPASFERTPWLAAVMLGAGLEDARDLLERLADAHLVQPESADEPGWERYRLHDLTRLYAAERAATDLTARQRDQALARALASPMGRRRTVSARLCIV